MKIRISRIIIVIIITLSFIIIIVGLHVGIAQIVQHFDSRNWLIAEGTIVKSNVKNNYTNYEALFIIDIEYTFFLNKTEYRGKNYFERYNQKDLDTLVSDYPLGGIVIIRYDPENPNRSVLAENEILSKSISMIIGSVIFFLILIIGFIKEIKKDGILKAFTLLSSKVSK